MLSHQGWASQRTTLHVDAPTGVAQELLVQIFSLSCAPICAGRLRRCFFREGVNLGTPANFEREFRTAE